MVFKLYSTILTGILVCLITKIDAFCPMSNVNFEIDGNLTLRVLLDGHSDEECQRSLALGRTQIAATVWIVERLNFLKYLSNIEIGLKVFDTCSERKQHLSVFLESILNDTKCLQDALVAPFITTSDIADDISYLSKYFDSPIIKINENFDYELLIDITINFLSIMNFNKEIILLTNSNSIEELFSNSAKEEWLCVRDYYKLRTIPWNYIDDNDIIVLFGNKQEISETLAQFVNVPLKVTWIIVPVDGFAEFDNLPEDCYLILPSYADFYQTRRQYIKLTPSPVMINIAKSIINLLNKLRLTMDTFCQDHSNFIDLKNCLKTYKYSYQNDVDTTNQLNSYNILEILKIEQIHNKFHFEIYEIIDENLYEPNGGGIYFNSKDVITMLKIGAYNMFNRTLFFDQTKLKNGVKQFCKLSHLQCLTYCRNFNRFREHLMPDIDNMVDRMTLVIRWRSDAWIAALISVSSIGFFSTLAVLIFVFVRICKGDILEGNPTGSVLLLLTILLMYLSIIPISMTFDLMDLTQETNHYAHVPYNFKTNSTFQNRSVIFSETNDSFIHNSTTDDSVHNYTIETSGNTTFIHLLNFSSMDLEQIYAAIATDMNSNNSTDLNNSNYTVTTSMSDAATSMANNITLSTTEYNSTTPVNNLNETLSNISSIQYVIKFKNNSKIFKLNPLNGNDDNLINYNDPSINFLMYRTGEIQNLVCTYNAFAISLLYTFVFSLMLSRFVMVASVGHEGGFMSHVNGYIQTTLCFFMAIAQIGLCLELWMVYHDCATIYSGNFMLVLLSYDIFLLILLVLISPFVIRSQRNYKEGAMYTIAVYLIACVWAIWTTIYSLIDGTAWKDMILASSVVATATILLVCIFIPRTYLMMTGIVRDSLTNALPTLAHTQSTSVMDINYRTSQQVYDCVNPIAINSILRGHTEAATIPLHGQINPNYYSEAPGADDGLTEERIQYPDDHTYERYDTPPSPTKVTRF